MTIILCISNLLHLFIFFINFIISSRFINMKNHENLVNVHSFDLEKDQTQFIHQIYPKISTKWAYKNDMMNAKISSTYDIMRNNDDNYALKILWNHIFVGKNACHQLLGLSEKEEWKGKKEERMDEDGVEDGGERGWMWGRIDGWHLCVNERVKSWEKIGERNSNLKHFKYFIISGKER